MLQKNNELTYCFPFFLFINAGRQFPPWIIEVNNSIMWGWVEAIGKTLVHLNTLLEQMHFLFVFIYLFFLTVFRNVFSCAHYSTSWILGFCKQVIGSFLTEQWHLFNTRKSKKEEIIWDFESNWPYKGQTPITNLIGLVTSRFIWITADLNGWLVPFWHWL